MYKKVILLSSIATLIMSCNQLTENTEYIAITSDVNHVDSSAIKLQPMDGYTLMKAYCYACHNPNTKSHDDILAPPFKAVKMHYMREYETEEKFVKAMVDWVQNPNENKALMIGAVKRFKVMSKMPLPTEDLEKIASYIYNNNVEEPEWMEDHMKEMKGKM